MVSRQIQNIWRSVARNKTQLYVAKYYFGLSCIKGKHAQREQKRRVKGKQKKLQVKPLQKGSLPHTYKIHWRWWGYAPKYPWSVSEKNSKNRRAIFNNVRCSQVIVLKYKRLMNHFETSYCTKRLVGLQFKILVDRRNAFWLASHRKNDSFTIMDNQRA